MAKTKRKTQTTKSEPKEKPKRGAKPVLPSSLRKRGNPKPKTAFKPGVEHANPTGPAKGQVVAYDREEMEARKLDKTMVNRYISQNLMATEQELEAKLKDPSISMFEKSIMRIIIATYIGADQYRMDFLLNRLIGTVTQKIQAEKPNPFEGMSDEDLIRRKQELTVINRITLSHIERERGYIPMEKDITNVAESSIAHQPTDTTGTPKAD